MNRMRSLVLLVVTGILQLAPSLTAQEQVFDAKVPFQFTAGDRTLPAGEYRIAREKDFVNVENRENHCTAVILASNTDPSRDDHVLLIFDEVDNVFYLRKVVAPIGSTQLAVSRTEKKAINQHHLSMASIPTTTVSAGTIGGQ